jgi:hypothetical protein
VTNAPENAVTATSEVVTSTTLDALSLYEVGLITANANVRGGPSTNFGVVASISNGQTVTITAVSDDRQWYHIRLQNDQEGWISGSLVDVLGLPTSTPDVAVAMSLAATGVESNGEWIPVIQTFDGVEMVLVPKACPGTPCNGHAFWIDRFEVDNAQFRNFEGEVGFPGYWTLDDYPMLNITWSEAQAFCEKRGVRLPTNDEWQTAAAGPSNLRYPWGNVFDASRARYRDNSGLQPTRVGSYPANASWVGALDMTGNVWEWVNSSAYNQTRILRGGSFASLERTLENTRTSAENPTARLQDVGFRCARSFS